MFTNDDTIDSVVDSGGDPFDDPLSDSTQEPLEPSRASIKSFWLGCVGLSILSLVGTLLVSTLVAKYEIPFLETSLWTAASWQVLAAWHFSVYTCLMPCMVVGSVLPILYWRGSLLQRFAISIVIAITAMNISSEIVWQYNHSHFIAKWLRVGQIGTCWLLLPILFLLTPIKTRALRLVVCSGLLTIAFCISILPMNGVPNRQHVLFWETLYCVAFCFALLRRNWGRMAILEATATTNQIERTSSRTLLELMAVSGIAIAAAMFWSRGLDANDYKSLLISTLIAATLGISVVALSMFYFRSALKRSSIHLWRLLAVSLAVGLLFSIIAEVKYYEYANAWFVLVDPSSPTLPFALTCGFIASVSFAINLALCAWWLRFCGWSIDQTADGEIHTGI